jgi:hypothetical protein
MKTARWRKEINKESSYNVHCLIAAFYSWSWWTLRYVVVELRPVMGPISILPMTNEYGAMMK